MQHDYSRFLPLYFFDQKKVEPWVIIVRNINQ
jgi:hypothetical protein